MVCNAEELATLFNAVAGGDAWYRKVLTPERHAYYEKLIFTFDTVSQRLQVLFFLLFSRIFFYFLVSFLHAHTSTYV